MLFAMTTEKILTELQFNSISIAADYVIAEVDEYVKAGEIDPNYVTVPGIFINSIVKVGR